MKKVIFTLVIVFITVISVNAQDLTSKKGFPILPETGDICLSIDAVPFFVYAGNFFHGSEKTMAPNWNFPGFGTLGTNVPMFTISLKKFINPKTAYRARIRIGYNIDTKKNILRDQNDTISLTNPSTVTDKWSNSQLNIALGFGLEKRRGKGRVQGIYGAMANVMLSSVGNKFTYGNAFSSNFTDPESTIYPWREISPGVYETAHETDRVTKYNEGMTFGIGVNAFIGVEYFFAPKMSIGGEFSWGVIFQVTGKSKEVGEYWSDGAVKTHETKEGGSTYFGIDNTNSGGCINLSFYF